VTERSELATVAASAIGVHHDETLARGDAVEAGHLHGVVGVAAPAMQDNHNGRGSIAGSEVVDEIRPLASSDGERVFSRAGRRHRGGSSLSLTGRDTRPESQDDSHYRRRSRAEFSGTSSWRMSSHPPIASHSLAL
jgi:hypothetical protein